MKKVAVLQSNYVPWKGYFDIIHNVDEFIFYDDVKYTKNDWRNRNLILTNTGLKWMTIPISCETNTLIDEVNLPIHTWQKKHYKMLMQTYAKAPFLSRYRDFLDYVYLDRVWDNLSDLNQYLIKNIAYNFLGIKTTFSNSRDYYKAGTKLDRLLSLLTSAHANAYLSGPAAKNYIDENSFKNMNIDLEWMNYIGYPDYSQIHNHDACVHGVSILDLLFNTGNDAAWYIWGWRHSPHP